MSFERTTSCGVISGTACQWPGIAAYKGIRYATAGRWEFPVPVTHWDGVYDATQYGACCYQPRAFYDAAAAPGKAFYYNEFRKGETYTYSEDCLFLNIWAPADAAPGDRLPVIFYIHGGGFTGGCGHEKHFDGPVWPTKGCVAVTINYRLGPMGFVCLPELADEAGSTGNYAFLDQLAALRATFDRGGVLKNGVGAVILGRPNAGKSSLLNALARREAVIVSDIAGTTRDAIDIYMDLNGYPVIFTDTAGLRETDEQIEKKGIEIAYDKAASADLVIALTDGQNVDFSPFE